MTLKMDTPLVLVVDDQIPTTTMLEYIFKREGYEVKSVYDGAEAFEIAQRLLPDLILLDINMPGMNGLDVLKALRETPTTTNIPTILITARSEPADIAYGLDLGADDYLPKPFHPRELLARAQSKMKARRLEEALQRRTQDLEALLRASEELNQHLEIEELLDLILYLVLDLLPGDLSIIYRINEDVDFLDYRIQQKPGTPFSDTLVHQDIVKQFLNGDSNSIVWPDDVEPLVPGFTGGMAVALRHGADLHGILVLCAHKSFDSNHYRLFSGIATQATLALRNAELYEIQINYALHLEDMVSARTAELQSAQQMLIQAEKLASVGRLAASIAHEINNPLLPISINLEHMHEDVQSNVRIDAEEIEKTQESVERIRRIVERLLQFSKPDTGAAGFKPLNVVDIIQDVVSLNRKYFENEHMTIETRFEPLPTIEGSREQLEQVFMNLVLNARAAMNENGKLQITGFADKQKASVVIEFEDNGCGISPDLINTIFEPFVSTKEKGTGLGLFISYGILQNHGGSIDVESEVNVGTTFTVRLPIPDK